MQDPVLQQPKVEGHEKYATLMNNVGRIVYWLISLLSLQLVCGCQNGPPPALNASLTIKGSNTFGEELAVKLIAAYRQRQPNVSIQLESKGTASGIKALLDGQCDIASCSRLPNEEETKSAAAAGIEMNRAIVGYYGVAIVVNSANRVTALTRSQVQDIFSGTINNWKAVGGSDSAIHVYIRDPAAATNLGFRELAMQNHTYVSTAKTFASYVLIAEAVKKDPLAIGYASMGKARRAGIEALAIDQIAPTVWSVNEGQYPYIRVLRLLTDKAKQTPAATDFIKFVQSSQGQDIVDDLGFVRRLEPRLDSYSQD